MIHVSEQPQLSVTALGVNVALEGTGQLLYGHSDIVAGVKGGTMEREREAEKKSVLGGERNGRGGDVGVYFLTSFLPY